MADGLDETLDAANDAAIEEFDTGDLDAVQGCPRSRGRVLVDKAKAGFRNMKQKLQSFRSSVKEKFKNMFTQTDRDGLEMMKDNTGVFPIFNAHGFAVDAIFYRVNKEFGWGKKEESAEAEGTQ